MKYFEKSKSVGSFLHQYYCTIEYGKRMYVHNKRSIVSNTYNPYDDYLTTYATTKVDSVESVEITMPVKQFEKLVDDHEELVDLKCFTGFNSVDLIKHDYGQLREQYFVNLNEKRIRDGNETVRAAYEHYQMLLNLAR